ncbi:GPW/gp25 family protein [Halosquirtibacter laminarini]|uniref:GPW/gp25 family protein n=1 Tax=Halosquirtibacter laminarini TaxID=3374600 RepID=A0AC61NKU8_9BACT|nr:GPW/gp25 family protein [Prolixibacteraceae bacterium]
MNGDNFLGTGWKFPISFDRSTHQVKTVTAEEDIKESLMVLLSTSPGERVMHPEYGCRIKKMAFETMDGNVLSEMEDMIRSAILFFEPRIKVDKIVFDRSNIPQGCLVIQVYYVVNMTNTRNNIVYPFYLLEGTDL